MIANKAINTHEKVRNLQNRLYLTAKADRKRKFYALYDKIYRKDILEDAWRRVKRNKGAGGVDKVSIDDVKAYGEDRLLCEIAEELRTEKYRCKPVRRTYIPKPDGRKRALGIPTIKDRIVQMAAKIVIEPVFEADFQPCSYGFRPKRSAKQAMDRIFEVADKGGALWVIDADIRDYFGSINHDKLLLLVKQRITDRRVLKLIKGWLKAGVLENGQYSESTLGAPQGGVISPLLSNIYLNYFDICWNKRFGHLGELVRYADDFVILCKRKAQAEEALKVVKRIMDKLELTLHGEKTRLVDMYFGKDSFDTYGHLSGDQTLIRIAEVIKGVIKRPGDFAARYGGEEFVAILMNTTAEGAAFVAEQIRTRVEELGIENREIKNVVTVSLGVASVVPDNEMEPNELIDAADRALYKAKEYGRNNVTVWESQQE